MRFMIYPYTQGSKGAKMLAESLQCKRILLEGSSYVPKEDDIIINWGSSECPFPQALNNDIKGALNKLTFFRRLEGLGLTPKFADTLEGAKTLTFPVFCRKKLEGRDGQGIVIADKAEELIPAKLYVEGIDKTSEYRIHMGRLPDGVVEIVGRQKKVHVATDSDQDARVWTGDGTSLVWTVDGQPAYIPPSVLQVAEKAFEKFPELTFGAFDVCYNNSTGQAYVLELNSAPMGTPETTRRYSEFFKKIATSRMMEEAGLGQAPQTPVEAFFQAEATQAPPEPVSVPGEAPAQTMTVNSVMLDLADEKISLGAVIQGYISSIRG